MRIFKIYLITFISILFGQNVSVVVDEKLISDLPSDSLEILLKNELISRGYFGSEIELAAYRNKKLHYKFDDRPKMIDHLLFHKSIPVNTKILKKIFTPVKKMDNMESASSFVRQLHTSYPFIPNDFKILYGLLENNDLGALIDFSPDFNSHFSGIIGAGQQNGDEWNYSGEMDIHLENTWQNASITDLKWKRQNKQSQYLRFVNEELFPFNLPFGTKIEFSQDLRENNYVLNKVSGALSFRLGLKGKWYFGGGKETLKPTEQGIASQVKSYQTKSLFMEYMGDSKDDRWLPERGLVWDIKSEVGQLRETGKDSLTARLHLSVEQYFPIHDRLSVKIKYWGRLIWNENNAIHEGQMIRYGGVNSLRGYHEEIFMSDAVTITTVSMIFSPNNNLQLFTFSDMAFQDQLKENPFSIGFGLRQKSTNSVTEISFGWPRDEAFSGGKIHVKFVSLID